MGLSITFLGHSGFVLDDGTHRLAIDPFLTGNPRAVHAPEELDVTHIALTHGHADHVGDTVAIAKRTGATVIGAFEIANFMGEQGVAETIGGNPGGSVPLAFGSVSFTHAFHSSSYEGRYMGMPCGLVVEMGGVTLYHAGDTGLFSDMKLIGEIYSPDIAALPIGDLFTMGPALASRAAEWVGAKTAIPVHYKTFPPLAQSSAGFDPKGVTVKEMEPGEVWQV
jgi:L-ascorbate metabolism protein UlaG (beta-lactamase superfamily)